MARKKRPLSDDDQHIWRRVTSSVDPLHPNKKQSLASPAVPVSPVVGAKPKDRSAQTPVKRTEPIQPFRIGSKAKTALPSKQPFAQAQGDQPGVNKVSPNMDRRNFQRLLRGQIDIDATLDLHGMTSDAARQRLVLFLQQAHARGARLVLVITGKGNKTHIDEFNRPRSGILRAALPDWLRAGALSGLVLQVTQAHPKHGGKGAFYVYLRRRR